MTPLRRLALLGGVLAALALLALGLRWQLSRAAETAMAELRHRLAPIGTLSWQEVRADLDGRIEARGLELVSDHARYLAEQLRFDLGGPLALLRRGLPGAADGLPTALRLELTGLDLPSGEPAADAALGLESIDVLPCDGLDARAVLQAVRGPRLQADLTLGWRFDAAARQVTVDATLRTRDLIEAELALELATPDPVARLEDLIAARPVARRGTLTIVERGWYAATAVYCAARSGLAPEVWLEAHLAGVLELLAGRGLAPSQALVDGYRGFRRAPGTLRISIDNPELYGGEALLGREPGEIAMLIGLAVTFDGVAIVDPGVGLAGAPRIAAAAPLADAPPDADGSLVAPSVRSLFTPVPPSPAAPSSRRSAPRRAPDPALLLAPGASALTPANRPPRDGTTLRWDALPRARGTPVAVVMKDGRTLRGTLREANPWRLTLELRQRSGSALMPLDRDAVARVVVED